MAPLSILFGVVLLVCVSTVPGGGSSDGINYLQDFCLNFNQLRNNPGSSGSMSVLYRALVANKIEIENLGLIPTGLPVPIVAPIALERHCVEPSTYFNPECLFARRYEISYGNNDWSYLGNRQFHLTQVEMMNTYVDLWLLHPLLRDCLEYLNKPLSLNHAKNKLLRGLAMARPIPSPMPTSMSSQQHAVYADILRTATHGKTEFSKEIEKSCKKEPVIDQIFCRDLIDIVKLVDTYYTVKHESDTGLKWNAYRLYFAMIKHNDPDQYSNVYPTPQESNALIARNLEQIFQYVNSGQTTELTEMMTVVPETSSRSGCENLLSLPSSTINSCMFWITMTQIQAYLKSKIPLGNGQITKILNTNTDYPVFLALTQMDRILTVVQNTENALPRLNEWVISEVNKNVDERFRGLRSYFGNVESFNSQKSRADVDFVKGRLSDYRTDVETLSNDLSNKLGTILDYTFVAVGLNIAEKSVHVVLAGAVLMNPLEKLFGGGSVNDFMDRAAALANALASLGELLAVRNAFMEVQTTTATIGQKFENNDAFLENIYLLIQSIEQETTTAEFENRRLKFLADYTAYDPQVRRPELTGMTTKYENLIDAACDVIRDTDTTAAAIPKTMVLTSGMCPKAKEIAAKMFETMAEIYDYQFELIEAMASYMRAVTAQYAASDIVADYEEQSFGSNMNQNVINDLRTLTLVSYISYKINIWEVTESYCDILKYKEGGVRPNVCQGINTNIASLASHTSPICRNVEAYKDIPITPSSRYFRDLYAGKFVNFKVPGSNWLVTNNWIREEDRDSAIVVKKFEVFLPTNSATQHIVRSNIQVTGNNKLFPSSNTNYVIVPGKKFIFEYFEGQTDQPCRTQAFQNPYGANLPEICPLNVDENNCQELLRRTPLFPSIYSQLKLSIKGYERARVPTPANQDDFSIKFSVKLCIFGTNSNARDKVSKASKKSHGEMKKSRDETKPLHPQKRKTCPKGQYWSNKSSSCANCPKGSRPALGGYFCEKIPKKNK